MRTSLLLACCTSLAAAAPMALRTPGVNWKRCSPFDVFPIYYANDTANIHYSPGWTVITDQGDRDRGGVEAWNGLPDASYSFLAPFSSGSSSFTIYAGKKHDRGYFDVYLDGVYAGTGDAFDASCNPDACSSDALFSHDLGPSDDFSYKPNVTVVNRSFDDRLQATPYLDVNNILFITPNC